MERVTVSRLQAEVFYATILLAAPAQPPEVDARPSDALALAQRLEVPIFVDADGNGFAANGDELGWSLPTGKEEVETVKARLTRAGLNPLTARR